MNILKRINYYLELFDIVAGIIASIIIHAMYLYLLLIIKASISIIRFKIILWRKRLPRKLRRKLLSLYEDKIEEFISSTYRGFLEIKLLNKLYYMEKEA
jgi:hypothetical protein